MALLYGFYWVCKVVNMKLNLEWISVWYVLQVVNCFTCTYSFLDLKVLDEMGNRIDDLEKNIADLMTQAGVDDR